MNSILRKQAFQTQIYFGILLFALGLALFPRETSQAAAQSIELCAKVLAPSLFPFFVVSSLCMRTGLAKRAGQLFEKPMQFLFRMPGACASAFILGLVGGYPVGAASAASLFRQGLCTQKQAERLLAFCNNCGPGFIFGAVGSAMLNSPTLGLVLYLSHIGASVCTGLVFGIFSSRPSPFIHSSRRANAEDTAPFSKCFTEAVISSFSSVLNVSAFVIFFAAVTRLFTLSGVFPALSSALCNLAAFDVDPEFFSALASGFFEVTSGVQGLAALNCSVSAKLSACALLLGWGGLSVHCQTLSLITPAGLSARSYFKGKALHALFSLLLVRIILYFFPQTVPVFSAFSSALPPQAPQFISTLCNALRTSLACWAAFAVLAAVSRIISHCKKAKKAV